MTDLAFIMVSRPRADEPAAPAALLPAGGLSLLERLLRQVKALGIDEVIVLSPQYGAMLGGVLASIKLGPAIRRLITNPRELAHMVKPEQSVLLLEDGVLIDSRIMTAVVNNPLNTVLGVQSADIAEATALRIRGAVAGFASVAKLKGELLLARAAQPSSEEFIPSLLTAAGKSEGVGIVDIDNLDSYLPDRRRDVPILWRPLFTANDERAATTAIIAMAQKGTLDWPARYLHPWIENTITRLLLPTPVTPNQVTLLSGLIGFTATYLFATGALGWGLALALLLGPLDGVDGKLARTKMLTSKMGELEHVLDKLVEYSWFLALASWFAGQSGNNGPWAVAALIILFAWAEAVQGEFFRRMTGLQLDDFGKIERRIRLFAGRRNTFMWALVPFALLGEWMLGLWVLAGYSILTFFVAQWRFFVASRDFLSAQSALIAKNFRDSAFFPGNSVHKQKK